MVASTAVPGARDPGHAQVLFAGACALVLTIGLARFAYTPLLPVMRSEAGMSWLAGGWLATFNYLGYLAGALVAAAVRDLQLKFQMYRAGLMVAVLSTAAMAWTQDVFLWGALRFIAGLSSATGLLIGSGLVLDWLMRKGHRAELGVHFMGLGLGIIVSGVAVMLMQPWLAWDGQWLALGALGLALAVPAWCWMPAPAGKGAAPVAPPEGAPAPSGRWMGLLTGAYFCAGFGYVVSATFIVAILERMPLLAGKGVWLWVLIGAAAMPSTVLWDRIARRVGYVRALLLGFIVHTVAILLPALTQDPAINVISGLLYGGTVIGLVSLTLTLIGRRFPGNPATAMARLTLSYGVAQIVAPAMAGFIAVATGSYAGALVVAAAVMALGVVLLLGMLRLERREQPRT